LSLARGQIRRAKIMLLDIEVPFNRGFFLV